MNMKSIISASLALSCFNWAPLIWAESCDSRSEYFTAVDPFNSAMSQEVDSSFSSGLCGQDVSITSVSGEPINIASIATSIRPDGSVVYAEDIVIKVGDKEVFNGSDFTEDDLDRLLNELGAEVESQATIAQVQQVNRQTYNTISTRLMNIISRSFIVQTETASINTMAASTDDIKNTDNSLATWSEVSYAKVKDDNQPVNFSTDIYQVVGGLDKRFGNLIIGSAMTYSHAENKQTARDYSSNSIGITPYIAYKVTDYMFLSGLLGYNYTALDSRSAAPDSDFHEFTVEGNLNAYKAISDFVFKGRAGVRYTYGDIQQNNDRNGSSDSISAIADVQIDYLINEQAIFYIGSQYEYLHLSSNGIDSRYEDGVFYFRSGLDFAINNRISIGAVIETDLSDSKRDLIKGGINFRWIL